MRAVIVGAGPGGLEAALALRGAVGCDVEVQLVAASPRFVYRPVSVMTPFNGAPAVEIDVAAMAAERGFAFTQATLDRVDAAARRIETSAGTLDYDALILALGSRRIPSVAGALPFGGPHDAEALTAALGALEDGQRICFVANASSVWSLPAYELALQTAASMRAQGRAVKVGLVTGELSELEDFGPDASARVARLLDEADVEVYLHTVPDEFDEGRLWVPMAGAIDTDQAVALPALAPEPTPGVVADDLGFVPVDDYGRVRGMDDVFAVGDMTDRRLKQGGLATQQADVVAALIAARAGGTQDVEPYRPVLRAKLLTGGDPVYLRFPEVDTPRPEEGFEAPWWPPHKIVGHHLGPYLAAHAELMATPR